MDFLTMGFLNLRIAEFFLGNTPPTAGDIARMRRGATFIDRSLGAVSYLYEGQTELLEEGSFDEARYVCFTLSVLKRARTYPNVKKQLELLRDDLDRCANGDSLTPANRRNLAEFFEALGESLVVERALDPLDLGDVSDRDTRQADALVA